MDPSIPVQPPQPAPPMTPSTPPVPPIQTPIPQVPPIQSAPIVPPSPAPKKVSGVLIAGLILLFVSVLALVGYYFIQTNGLKVNVSTPIASPEPSAQAGTPAPTADPTADWQIFNNSGWKVTFKYPSTFSTLTTSGGEYFSTDSKTGINLRLSKGIITNSDIYSLAFQTAIGQQVVSIENTKVANLITDGRTTSLISMDYLKDTQDVPSYSYVYIIKDGSSLYTLDFWQDQTQSQNVKSNILNDQSLFDQILSTFKFTSPTASTIPADWKTYTNTNGYQISYPTDYKVAVNGYGIGQDVASADFVSFIISGSDVPTQNEHLGIEIIASDNKTLAATAQGSFDQNIQHPGIQAKQVEAPTLKTFQGSQAYEYVISSKGLVIPSSEYLGLEGEYKVIWTKLGSRFAIIYLTNTSKMNQLLSSFKFSN